MALFERLSRCDKIIWFRIEMLSEKGIINFLAFGILGLLSQGFSFQLS